MVEASIQPALLEVEKLSVSFTTPRAKVYAVRDVSFRLEAGKTMGLVGESGSGKSVCLRALLGLLASAGHIDAGRVIFDGTDLVRESERGLQAIRGRHVAMIFQDPMGSLNPVLTVGDQLTEMLREKAGLAREAAFDRAVELFERVGIRPARMRLKAYPHQFSGGMAQRVMIAIAIAAHPRLLLADEPTTALDVSIQDQVLALLEDLRIETGMAMVLVSHDIGVIARACQDVAVMYAGHVLEYGSVEEVLTDARHPYTRMLLATVPSLRPNVERRPLASIGGQLPDMTEMAGGCPFAPRCTLTRPECLTLDPVLRQISTTSHASACPFS